MTGKLPSDIDVSKLTPREASSWIASLAQNIVAEQEIDLLRAWSQAKSLNPELAQKASEPQPPEPVNVQRVQYANPSAGSKSASQPYPSGRPGPGIISALMPKAPMSLPNDGNIEALGLGPDCSFDEFRAADIANMGKKPRDSRVVFNALVGHHVGRGMSPESATEHVQKRFPVLSAEAQQAEQAIRHESLSKLAN